MEAEIEASPETSRRRRAGQGAGGSLVARWLASLGKAAEGLVRHAGQIAAIFGGIAFALVRGQVALRPVLREMYAMGVQSLPIVLVAAILSGVVTSQQGGYQ